MNPANGRGLVVDGASGVVILADSWGTGSFGATPLPPITKGGLLLGRIDASGAPIAARVLSTVGDGTFTGAVVDSASGMMYALVHGGETTSMLDDGTPVPSGQSALLARRAP